MQKEMFDYMNLVYRKKEDKNGILLSENVLGNKIREILAANDGYYEDFYNKYLVIDKLLRKEKQNIRLVYNFKGEFPCEFSIENINGETKLTLKDDQTNIILGNELTVAELYKLCEQIDKQIASRRLFFSPEPDDEFIKDIMNSKKGDIFSYNNRNAFVCVEDTPGNKIFKYAFSGNIMSIKIGDFERSETFHVQNANSHDLKYMYSLAYDYKSVSTMRRKYDFSLANGYYPVTEIEQNHVPGTVTSCTIGNCKLRLIDEDKKLSWYDADGKQISRDTIALVFVWTKTVAADINFVNENWEPNCQIEEKNIQRINDFLQNEDTKGLLKEIANYSSRNNNYASISFTGLYQEGLNYTPVTFAFAKTEQGLVVYKFIQDQDNERIVESSQSEFIDFYKQRYQSVKEITLKQFKNYNSEQKDIIFKEIVKKSSDNNKSMLGKVSSEERTQINSMLSSYLEDKRNGRKYAPIKDIISAKHIHTSSNKNDLFDEVIEKD